MIVSKTNNEKRGVTMKIFDVANDNNMEMEEDWKTEFLELYMSDDVEKLDKALALKQLHIPKRLYRYRTLSDDNRVILRVNTADYISIFTKPYRWFYYIASISSTTTSK